MGKSNRDKINLLLLEKLPKILMQARLTAAMTQSEVAQKSGVLQSALSRYEHGFSCPDIKTWVALCHTLEIHPGSVFTDIIMQLEHE